MVLIYSKKSINVPKKIEKEIKKISRDLRISEKKLLLNAILNYFKIFKKNDAELKKELKMWERAGDEDLIKFENNL